MDESTEKQLDRATDQQSVLEVLAQTRTRGDTSKAIELANQYLEQNPNDEEVKYALEHFEERIEWRMYLWAYLPSFIIAYLLIGYFSGQWGIAVVAAMVAAYPGMVLIGIITLPFAARTKWTSDTSGR